MLVWTLLLVSCVSSAAGVGGLLVARRREFKGLRSELVILLGDPLSRIVVWTSDGLLLLLDAGFEEQAPAPMVIWLMVGARLASSQLEAELCGWDNPNPLTTAGLNETRQFVLCSCFTNWR